MMRHQSGTRSLDGSVRVGHCCDARATANIARTGRERCTSGQDLGE